MAHASNSEISIAPDLVCHGKKKEKKEEKRGDGQRQLFNIMCNK